MKNYRQLIKELPSKSVVFAFGRFNPPTIGHELLFKVVKKLAASHKADHVIYASKTQDKKKNPLSVDRKVHYLRLMFPKTNFVAANEEVRTFIEAAKQLNKKYKNIIMVAGSDRVPEYTKLLNTYNGKEFNFDTIQVISAGERDPDADDASGMSASKMRAAATKGDYVTFKKGLPSSIRDIDGKLLMNEIRQGMGLDAIKEQIKFDVDSIREQYFRKEIFNIGDFVMVNEDIYEILDRGSNYVTVVDDEGNTSKKWIQECKPTSIISIDEAQLLEDIPVGYAPKEITFKGYTTKNFHHSADAADAFKQTIERYGKTDPVAVLNALKATDTYMKINDLHLEQGKAPDAKEIKQWREAHNKARESLQRIGEFIHHMDYWDAHHHELEGLEANYTPATAGADMNEELSTKTIKSTDKLKVARIIASFLGLDSVESLSNPDQIVNMGLRKVKNKALNSASIDMLHNMLKLADEVGVAYDSKLVPNKIKESIDSRVTVDPKSGYNAAKDILRYSDFKKLLKMNKGEIKEGASTVEDDEIQVLDDTGINPSAASELSGKQKAGEKHKVTKVGHTLHNDEDDDQLRRRKVAYKLGEEVEEIEEASLKDACWKGYEAIGTKKKNGKEVPNCVPVKEEEIEEDQASADYKVNPETGRKYRAHVINFKNSKSKGELADDPDKEEVKEAKKVAKVKVDNDENQLGLTNSKGFDAFFEEADLDLDDNDLDKMVDALKGEEDILDAYDDDELAIVDDETGEELENVKEEVINEVLSRMERIRAKARFARTASKRERKTKLALKRHSDTATINKRARRLAVALIKKRITKKQDLSKLSTSEKERVELMLQKRKALINRLAMKLSSRVRKIENDRLSHSKYTKK